MNRDAIAGQQGAVDLSSMVAKSQEAATQGAGFTGAPASVPAGGDTNSAPVSVVSAPLITDITEASFDEMMVLSQTVPVVLVLYTPKSIASKQALEAVESVARKSAGAFQVGRVDVEAHPTLASAFQPQSIPTGFAVVARRPVPLFEGVPTEVQLEQILQELFQVAPQLGVVGRIAVSEDDLERPVPAEHIPAREAEDAGDWQGAIAAWKKVLASFPSDQEAKTALVRAQFQARQEETESSGSDSVDVAADSLFASGDEAAAFDLLLNAMGSAVDADQRESLRLRIVELFQIAGDAAAVKAARSRLATMLMV